MNLKEITLTLQNLAQSNGYNGTSIDALCLLLARSIYENKIWNTNMALESSFNRSNLLNSRINHAFDCGYSVFRGENQIITFKNLITVNNINVKKLDLLMNLGKYKLVYAEDYNIQSNTRNVEIKCFLTKEIKSFITTIDNNNAFTCNITDNNISESCSLYINGTSVGYSSSLYSVLDLPFSFDKVNTKSEIPTNGSANNRLFLTNDGTLYCGSITGAEPKILAKNLPVFTNTIVIQTISGYGCCLINRNINGIGAYQKNDIVRLDYLPFIEDEITAEDIKKVTGYNFPEVLEIELTPPKQPNKIIDDIFYRAINNYRENYVIRSNSDFVSIIKSFFSDYVDSVNIVKQFINDDIILLNINESPYEVPLYLNIVINNSTTIDTKVNRSTLKVLNVETQEWEDCPEVFTTKQINSSVFVKCIDSTIGNFNSVSAYTKGTIVINNNLYYQCLQNIEVNSGILITDETYWLEVDNPKQPVSYYFYSDNNGFISLKNSQFIKLTDYNYWEYKNYPIHDSSLTYNRGDIVYDSVNNKVYQAIIDVEVGVLLNNTTYWSEITSTPFDIDDFYLENTLCTGQYVQDTYTSIYNSNAYVIGNCYYIGENIRNEKIEEFYEFIEQSYNISNVGINFINAIKYNNADYNLGIKVHYGTNANFSTISSDIQKIVDEYKLLIGKKINLYEIASKINLLPNVNYCEFIGGRSVYSIELNENEYLSISNGTSSITFQLDM